MKLFLNGSVEVRLDVVEKYPKPDSLQSLFIIMVELMVDVGNIAIFLKDCFHHFGIGWPLPLCKSVNHMKAAMVKRLRETVSDSELVPVTGTA